MTYQRSEYIATGQLKIGKSQSVIYKAYLGTCLGVALYDESSKIGGIIHTLLPEPTGIASAAFPEKYAATGVPILIQRMLKLGARPENLKATIAGGALIGPVTRQDINLDIGGRSVDIAISILKDSGIDKIKSETGGFFSCSLELNMGTGKTRIIPARENIGKSHHHFKPPSLDDILSTIDRLKPIPQIALKILRMFQSSRHHIEEITDELSKDQVLSGMTLRLCNSALFSGAMKIGSLKDAVLILGKETLMKSIIIAAVDMYYNQIGSFGYSLCKGGLFFHAVGVASASEKIAEKSGKSFLKDVYTAGLLHDIGKVILDQYLADISPLFFRKLYQKNEDFVSLEKKLLGITHGEAGALLAKKWNFPNELSEVIQLHHTPEKTKKNKDIVHIIYIANIIMEKFHAGFDLEKMQTKSLENSLKHLGFKMADFPGLVDIIPINAFNKSTMLTRPS